MQDVDILKKRLQDNLLLIRRTAGWTATDLGEKIDLSKQTINNLERKDSRYEMKRTQYYAIRTVLDEEIKNNPDTKMLKDILDIFVDHPEDYDEQKREEYLSLANVLAPSVLMNDDNASRKNTSIMWDIAKGAIAIGVSAALMLISENAAKSATIKKVKK